MDLYEAMRTLPSVKRYKPDPVSDDDIRTILTALIPLGYPADDFKPVTRIPAEEFTHWDGWQRD